MKAKRFIFDDIQSDQTGRWSFGYHVERTDGSSQTYKEVLTFPASLDSAWKDIPRPLLESFLKNIHIALGLSYWKMHCSETIELRHHTLTKDEAQFWTTAYTKGLGEFFYKNKIDFRDLVHFRSESTIQPQPISYPRTNRCLLPFGGGKDSIVAAELFKQAGKDFTLYSLGSSFVQEEGSKVVGKNLLIVQRELDKKMIEQSKQGEVYNGHIPISLIYTFVGLLVACLDDDRYVVFPNERSANIGNVEYLGQEINHQWSKSEECEQLVRRHIASNITPDVIPFSLLRPWSELRIVQTFASFKMYHHLFSSCNRNFKINVAEKPTSTFWCGKCPKCAFVFTCLSAFISRDELVSIFRKNLFEDEKLVPLFRELLGVEGIKPFECVGTPDEVRWALWKGSKTQEYEKTPIMRMFLEETKEEADEVFERLGQELLTTGSEDTIPKEFQSLILPESL